MNFAMPLYEVRYHHSKEWEELTEIQLLQKLVETYDRVTPAIQQLIEGKEVLTVEAVYRLKFKGGAIAPKPIK
jgi:hypothetical protein